MTEQVFANGERIRVADGLIDQSMICNCCESGRVYAWTVEENKQVVFMGNVPANEHVFLGLQAGVGENVLYVEGLACIDEESHRFCQSEGFAGVWREMPRDLRVD